MVFPLRAALRPDLLELLAILVRARRDLPSVLRAVGGGDPALARIAGRLASMLEQGAGLDAALRRCRLVDRDQADRLAACTDADMLAEELQRQADATVPQRGLPCWFTGLPWLLVAASAVPAMAMCIIVEATIGVDFGAVWQPLLNYQVGSAAALSGPPSQALNLLLGTVIALAVMTILVQAVRQVPGVRHLALFGWFASLHRLALQLRLLDHAKYEQAHGPRHGHRGWPVWWRCWRDHAVLDRDRKESTICLQRSGDDLATTLLTLGLVPSNADGGPDWTRGAELLRERVRLELAAWRPFLVSLLGLAALWGLLHLGMFAPVGSVGDFLDMQTTLPGTDSSPFTAWPALSVAWAQVVTAGQLIGAAWVASTLWTLAGDWFVRRPTRIVLCTRLAQVLRLRREPAPVLRAVARTASRQVGTRLQRAATALENRPETDLVDQLAVHRLLPGGQLPALRAAAPAGPEALASAFARLAGPEDPHPVHASERHPPLLLSVYALLIVIACCGYLLVGIFPRLHRMVADLSVAPSPITEVLIAVGQWLSTHALLVAGILLVMVIAIEELARLGWARGWFSGRDRRREQAADILLDGLSRGADEATLARMLAGLCRQPAALTRAAAAGDLAAMMQLCGWRHVTPKALPAAVGVHRHRRLARRERRLALAAIVMPVLIATPLFLAMFGFFDLHGTVLRHLMRETGFGPPLEVDHER